MTEIVITICDLRLLPKRDLCSSRVLRRVSGQPMGPIFKGVKGSPERSVTDYQPVLCAA